MFIFGRAYGDASVLSVGSAIEKLMKVKEQLVPYILPETDIADIIGS